MIFWMGLSEDPEFYGKLKQASWPKRIKVPCKQPKKNIRKRKGAPAKKQKAKRRKPNKFLITQSPPKIIANSA